MNGIDTKVDKYNTKLKQKYLFMSHFYIYINYWQFQSSIGPECGHRSLFLTFFNKVRQDIMDIFVIINF